MKQHLTVKLALEQSPPPYEALRPEAVRLRQEGASYDEITRVLGLSRYLIKKAFVEMGFIDPPSKYGPCKVDIPRQRIEELIAQGKTRHEMEALLGISNRSVLALLARYGLKAPQVHRVNMDLAKEGRRRCSECKEIKSLEKDFYNAEGKIAGKGYRCRACSKKWLKIRSKRYKERQAQRKRQADSSASNSFVMP